MGSRDSRNPLDGVDWGKTVAQAVAAALKFVRKEDAEDLAMEGMKRVIEGSAPWDSAGKRTLVAHIVAVGLERQRSERRKKHRHREPEFVEALAHEAESGRPFTPEEAAFESEARDRKARLFARLVALCAEDADALAVLECEQDGIHEAADQARQCGFEIEAVRNARKRIKRRVETLIDSDDANNEEEASA